VPDFEQNGSLIPGRQPGYSWRKVIADLLESNQRAPELARRFRRHPAHHDLRWHWPLGTCLFLPAALFESAGGFDERYFLYMEDVEFGHQFHRHGGDVIALGTRLHHGSMQGSSLEAGARRRLLNAARVQFARRHYGPLIGWWAGRLARP
jgi:GT2 family glycosyltransferase